MTRTALEAKLGPHAAFIITPENRWLVAQWAISTGLPAAQVHSMTAPQLANLYHAAEHAPSSDMVAAAQAWIDSVVGVKHYIVPRVYRAVRRGDAVMQVGPAGCGKTRVGEDVAAMLGLACYVTSSVSDTHELMGYRDGYGQYHSTAFRTAFESGGLWIADEIDAWEANALLVANSALANGLATFPDVATPIRRHADFRMVATANTFGTGADRLYVGRTELDAASLDRFCVIEVDYDLDLERRFAAGEHEWLDFVWRVRRNVQSRRIRHVVSSRAITMGARALRDGEEWDDAVSMYVRKGLQQSDWDKVS